MLILVQLIAHLVHFQPIHVLHYLKLLDELVKNVNAIQTTDTNNLVKTAKYNTENAKIEKKLDHGYDK